MPQPTHAPRAPASPAPWHRGLHGRRRRGLRRRRVRLPDDEGARDAGIIELVFTAPVHTFGFDLIDAEDENMEAGMVVGVRDGAASASIAWTDFVAGGAFEVAGRAFGDDSANRIPRIAPSDVGLARFDRVEIFLGGSGAIDDVVIPEPAGAGLAGLGLTALARRARARRRRDCAHEAPPLHRSAWRNPETPWSSST